MKSIKTLLIIFSISTPLIVHAKDSDNIRKAFIKNSGVMEMCKEKKFLGCLGLEAKKCRSAVSSCLEIVPKKATKEQMQHQHALMNKFNSCLLEELNLSEKKLDSCS